MKRESIRIAGKVSIPLGVGVRLSPGEQKLVEERAWVMHCDAAGRCWASRRRPQGNIVGILLGS